MISTTTEPSVQIEHAPVAKKETVDNEVAHKSVPPESSDLDTNVPIDPVPYATTIGTTSKKVSAFSLSSIKAKKDLIEQQKNTFVEKSNDPTSPFTFQEMIHHWNTYAEKLGQRGMKIMESLLMMNVPTLEHFLIKFELPNAGSKLDFESEKTPLLQYLRSNLSNHDIDIQVIVNETISRKFAFTAEEKYDRLCGINPLLENLKRTFDLDF